MIHLTLHQLSAHLDGELAEASTELVRRHLSQCPECTVRFALIENQEEILECLLNHDPGDEFFEFFLDHVHVDNRKRPPTRWPRPAATQPQPRDGVHPPATPAAPVTPSVPEPVPTPEPAPVPESVAAPSDVPARLPAVEMGSGGARSPALYGRREDDHRPAPPWGAASGWIVAGIVSIVALSVAFVGTRSRIAPLPIPAVDATPSRDIASVEKVVEPDAPAETEKADVVAPRETRSPPVDVAAEPPASAARAPRAETRLPEVTATPPPSHIVPVRRIITTTTIGTAAPPPEPDAPAPAARTAEREVPEAGAVVTIRDMGRARELSLVAARTMTSSAFESAADAWERLLPQLAQAPEDQAIARREIAQTRFQAWVVDPSPARREVAITAARAYLLYAPPGLDRDQGWTWLGRLKR